MINCSTVQIGILICIFILAQLYAYNKLSVIRKFQALRTIQLSDEEALVELGLLCSKLKIKLFLLDRNCLESMELQNLEFPKHFLKEDQFDKFYSFGLDGKKLHRFQSQVSFK